MRRRFDPVEERIFSALYEFRKNALHTILLTPAIPLTYYLTNKLMLSNEFNNHVSIACGIISAIPAARAWVHTASSAKNALLTFGEELDI